MIEYTEKLLEKYKKEEEKLIEIKNLKNFTDMVENQIRNNILLPNFTNRTFTDSNLKKTFELKSEKENRIEEISSWLEKNETLLDYKRNQRNLAYV